MISKDTTAKEVVIQAIREFAVTATPDQYSLCEVSVTPEGVIKQRRLPDQLSKLADRIQLSGRYRLSRHPLLSKPMPGAKRQHICCCFVFIVVKREPKALLSTLPLSPSREISKMNSLDFCFFFFSSLVFYAMSLFLSLSWYGSKPWCSDLLFSTWDGDLLSLCHFYFQPQH